MALADFKFIENLIKDGKIGYNKEINEISIENVDNSTHKHYHLHLHVSLPPGTLPMEVVRLLKDNTVTTFEKAVEEKPKEMEQLVDKHSPARIATGASGVIASNMGKILREQVPLPSGEFVNQLPKIIEASTPVDIIKVDSYVKLEIIDIPTDKKEGDCKKT